MPVQRSEHTQTGSTACRNLTADSRQAIANAQFVSNPGCYPQGFLLLVRPLIDAGLLDPSTPLRCNAVSGYSGGGRQMIEQFQAMDSATANTRAVQSYGLDQSHKHLPEMSLYSGSHISPMFVPTVANYDQGMLTQVPLFASELGDATPQPCTRYLPNVMPTSLSSMSATLAIAACWKATT